MSLRESSSKPRVRNSHYSIVVARGETARTFHLRPGVLLGSLAVLPILFLACLASTLLFVFHNDLLASLMSRQAEMQYTYEDKLASMRTQMERMRSHELLSDQSFEGRLHDLFARQAQLETRATLVANLAERAGVAAEASRSAMSKAAEPKVVAQGSPNPLLGAGVASGSEPDLPAGTSSFAPITTGRPFAAPKPQPEPMQLRLSPSAKSGEPLPDNRQSAIDPEPTGSLAHASLDITLPARLAIAASALDRLEKKQVDALAQLRAPALAAADRLRTALAETGLPASRLIPPARADIGSPQGGPLVPVDVGRDSSAFARAFSQVQEAVLVTDRLRRVLPHVPLQKPLPGALEVTSGFGVRVDPFMGRAAMHTGIDLRDDYGAPVRATAAGRIVTAGWSGGYGNMVEVDHGNGIGTRYGHLSSILVHDGETVAPGTVLGRIGSTGRSTGPHLHYEVRIDDEAVDPSRFLRAGTRLASGS